MTTQVAALREPLLFCREPAEVVSSGFVQADLKNLSALIVIHPDADPEQVLASLAYALSHPTIREAMQMIRGDRRGPLQ